MKLARVRGTVVCTIQDPDLESHTLLLCDLLDASSQPTGDYVVAVDVVDAGPGDWVLVLDEGSSAREILGQEEAPVRAVVVGILDAVNAGHEEPA